MSSGIYKLKDVHKFEAGDNWPVTEYPSFPSLDSADGIWTLTQVSRAVQGAVWPGTVLPSVLELNGSEVEVSSYVYNNSNTANTIVVTGSPITVKFSLWGAAGGNGSYSNGPGTGSGGFVQGTITLPVGTYYLYVGEGGKGPVSKNSTGGLGGWPNGGFGTQGDATGAGGGGMTMLSSATFSTGMADSTIFLIAGASGGSTGYNGQSGVGGGTTGGNSINSAQPSTGGTQSAGGTNNGSKLQGGNATGQRTSGTDDGGGGGGGYYGGGGGTSDANPGAGGSGYINTSVATNTTITQGGVPAAPDPDGRLLSGYAVGEGDDNLIPKDGADGLAFIEIIS